MTWIIDHIGAIVTALGALVAAAMGVSNKRSITEIHLTMNSRLDELLEATRKVGEAKGRDEERARTGGQNPIDR